MKATTLHLAAAAAAAVLLCAARCQAAAFTEGEAYDYDYKVGSYPCPGQCSCSSPAIECWNVTRVPMFPDPLPYMFNVARINIFAARDAVLQIPSRAFMNMSALQKLYIGPVPAGSNLTAPGAPDSRPWLSAQDDSLEGLNMDGWSAQMTLEGFRVSDEGLAQDFFYPLRIADFLNLTLRDMDVRAVARLAQTLKVATEIKIEYSTIRNSSGIATSENLTMSELSFNNSVILARILELRAVPLVEVTRRTFGNAFLLDQLRMPDCRISAVTEDAFWAMPALAWLSLEDNLLEAVPRRAFITLFNIRGISLARNRLRTLPAGLFLRNTDLGSVDLSGNQLTVLAHDLFAHMDVHSEHFHGVMIWDNVLDCRYRVFLEKHGLTEPGGTPGCFFGDSFVELFYGEENLKKC